MEPIKMICSSSVKSPGTPTPPWTLQAPARAAAAKATPNPAAAARLGPSPAAAPGPAPKRIRLLLVDDHPVVRRGISACLARHPHLEVVGEAGDGREGLRKARELSPDLVLMDIDMPEMNGLAVTELLRKERPETKVLVLSMHNQPDYVLRILQSGARGYVLKAAPPDELLTAIETIQGGESFFSADVAHTALNQFVLGRGQGPNPMDLTPRESEVLTQIAEGLSNKEIASLLGVGVRTVETHRERIMRKLGIHTTAGLTRFAISKGLITLRG
jgi:two-component system, NarL family, nitrate/nitrite response regulator NarL